MKENIPFPPFEFEAVKKLRTLGGAVLHLFTRHLGDQPLASHGDHLPREPQEEQLRFGWDSEGDYTDRSL